MRNTKEQKTMKSIDECIENAMKHSQEASPILTSPYKCVKCQDTKWITVYKDGLSYSGRCDCFKRARILNRIKKSGLEHELDIKTFETFETHEKYEVDMKQMGLSYVNAILHRNADASAGATNYSPIPWLFMGGAPGCGKTHLCTAVCSELLKNGKEVIYMQWSAESRRLKSAVMEDSYDAQMQVFIEAEILYIDDLLKQMSGSAPSATPADIKILFELLNNRHIQNRPTIITSEWALSRQLLPLDEGTFSRIYEHCKGYNLAIASLPNRNHRLLR